MPEEYCGYGGRERQGGAGQEHGSRLERRWMGRRRSPEIRAVICPGGWRGHPHLVARNPSMVCKTGSRIVVHDVWHTRLVIATLPGPSVGSECCHAPPGKGSLLSVAQEEGVGDLEIPLR